MYNRCVRRDRGAKPSLTRCSQLRADAGRIVTNHDIGVGPLELALFEVPARPGGPEDPRLMLAASTPNPGWIRQTVEITHAGRTYAVRTSRRKSVLGKLAGNIGLDAASIEVALHDPEQWLMSCSDRDLELGDNAMLLGSEAIQFGGAAPLGGGRFRLTTLLRGRAGTEAVSHAAGEKLVLLDRTALEPVNLPVLVPGKPVRASALGGSAECSLTLNPSGQLAADAMTGACLSQP